MKTAIPIVSTKLHPPIIRGTAEGRILQRRRLLDVLGLVTSRRLTLVCAGPGYGKTTLMSHITDLKLPTVWYSLSPSDQDLAVFISYLVEGVRRHRPGFGLRVLRLLSSEEKMSPSPERLAGELLNALDEIDDTKLIIVLDDYHDVDQNPAIRKATDYLLKHLPQNTHVVMGTRHSPHLPSLPRLRMIGEVGDVTEADLRFTMEEVQELFEHVYGIRATGDTAGAITMQTEGWVIGLQLAAQSLRSARGESAGSSGGGLPALGTNKKRLFEYLAEEVFKRQPSNVQRFLRESSILTAFSAQDCDEILERTDSLEMLRHIEQNNLFASEDEEGNWRYHHLFRDFLSQQLATQPGRMQTLYRRAGDVFRSRGHYVLAVQHYLEGGHYGGASRLIGEVGRAMLTASQFDTLTVWISQIPERDLLEAPRVSLLQAEVFELQGHYERALEWLDRASKGFALKGDGAGRSRVLRAKGSIAAWRMGHYSEAESLYREALDQLGPKDKEERADLLARIAMPYLEDGNPTEARRAYEQAVRLYEEIGDKEGLLATLINPGSWLHWMGGDFLLGLAELQRALALAEQLGSKHHQAECLAMTSLVLRQLDRCDEAMSCAQQGVALSREVGSVRLEAECLLNLGRACEGTRASLDLHASLRYARDAVRLTESEGYERVRVWAQMDECRLLRRLGDSAGALRAGEQAVATAERMGVGWFKACAQVNLAIALAGRDDARAEALLLSARDAYRRYQDKWNLTRINFSLAVQYRESKPREALERLGECLELARANGYDYWFREKRRSAVPLLAWAIDHGIHPDYCGHLLKTMAAETADDPQSLVLDGDEEILGVAGEKLRQIRSREQLPAMEAVAPGREKASGRSSYIVSGISLSQAVPLLRIRCFGSFGVYAGNRLVQEGEWRRKKAKSLLAYMALARDHTVTKEEVAETFWGDQEPEAARASVSKALHLLRQVLEPDSKGFPSSYIASEHGILKLRREMLDAIDVDEFLLHIDTAEKAERKGDLVQAAREYEASRDVYAGKLLADEPYEDWISSKRGRLENLYLSSMGKLARWSVDAHDYEPAIAYLHRILAEDPPREDSHLLLMRCLARVGRRSEALAQYDACRKALQLHIDVEPSRETQALYAKLVAGERI